MTEPADLNRLKWKCRRGMKELDIVLTHYLEHCFEEASDDEKHAFETILDMQDPELYFLMIGKKTSEDETIANIVTILQHTSRN